MNLTSDFTYYLDGKNLMNLLGKLKGAFRD